MSNFKENLYEKKSFIYQIGEEYYAIGANTFAKVTKTQELDNMELFQNALKKKNDRQIAKYMDKLMRIANSYRVDAREHYKLQEKLFQFIDGLETKDELIFQNLQRQVFAFDELTEKYQ
ncbi:hypothetical protein IMSAGC011_00064 [Lachnospiraceae bacterium]|nr:hypothetical protein IMSAGC011_00064 [Lachnospiraceae bacterium]